MFTWFECFRSVGDVWAVWLACAAVLGWSLYRVLSRLSFRKLRYLVADERGGTYVLPYMLTFPIYLLVMCLMIQSTMILMVKMFTMQAVSDAVRSAVVWRSAHPYDSNGGGDWAVEHAHFAAAIAMAPVASSQEIHMRNPQLDNEEIFHRTELDWDVLRHKIVAEARDPYVIAYQNIAEDNVQRDRVKASNFVRYRNEITPDRYNECKFRYAAWATRVEVDKNEELNTWNHDFQVELDYLMPMNIPGAGRILSLYHPPEVIIYDGRGEFYSRIIHTVANMPMETPKTENRLIGIGYDPSMLR